MSRPPKPKPEELEAGIEHIRYEIEMFIEGSRRIQEEWRNMKKMDRNITLESWLVHLRNLRDFLYGTGPRNNNIFARHYVSSERWSKGQVPDVIGRLHDQINYRVTHLSYDRPKREKFDWPVAEVTRQILEDIRCFLARLPSGRRAKLEKSIRAEITPRDAVDAVTTVSPSAFWTEE